MALIQTTANPKENKETITLIWFDPYIEECENTKKRQEKLREFIDYVIFYGDLYLCVTYIQNHEKETIFLITSGREASQILSQISKLRQLDSIFIFCLETDKYHDLTEKYSKIVGIYNSEADLCKSIEEQIDLVDKQLKTFSIFDKHKKSTKDLSKQSGEFIWFQLFKCVILRLPRNQQAKQEMIDTCRHYYRGNNKTLKSIDEFERNYQPQNAIQWYTKDSFVYRLLNKALRTSDIDQLHRFRYFIGDLSESLVREHKKFISSQGETVVLYRGGQLDKEEFDKLKETQGKLISTNGYLSTSRNPEVARIYVDKSGKPNVIPVLFEIHCDTQQLGQSVIFADIAHISQFDTEAEVLFDLDATFRLEFIEKEEDVQLIRLNATNEAEAITKHYIEETERETGEKSVAIILGKLMCDLGQYDKSLKYFQQLLNEPNDEDLAWIEYNIGRVLYFKGEWNIAREYYESAYKRMINANPSRIKDSASPLNNIGATLNRQRKYNEALKYYQRALEIKENFYPSGHVDIANSLNNIGVIFDRQGKYNEALNYYKRALEIKEKLHPSDHVDITSSLNNIGVILRSQEKHNEALDYYQRALAIKEKFYPSDHVDIADSLLNIGVCYGYMKQNKIALDYFQRASTIYEKFLPNGHPSRNRVKQHIYMVSESCVLI